MSGSAVGVSASGQIGCIACGRPLPGCAREVCAACLFSAGIGDDHERLGEYQLLERLGEGGMGEVWLALHDRDGFRALKRAKREIKANRTFLAHFAREIENAGRLRHPNIVRTFASVSSGTEPFLVMELLDGGSLAERRNRPQGAPAIGKFVLKLARAVASAHGAPLLHCDIKPDNILFHSSDAGEAQREPYLIDFGIARRGPSSGPLRNTGANAYTRGWASPEQVQGEPLSVQSDVFSLGALLYWLLSGGALPFGDGPDFERRILNERPAPLELPRWGLERDLGTVARRALERDLERRYDSVTKLVEDLERALHGQPLEGESRGRRSFRVVARHPYLTAAGGVLLPLLVHLTRVPVRFPEELRRAIGAQSAYAAAAQAGAMANGLRLRAERVRAIAADPNIVRLVNRQTLGDSPSALSAHAADFDLLFVFGTNGAVKARWPILSEYLYHQNGPCPENLAFRDYFLGQERLGRLGWPGVHVSRPFRSCLSREIFIAFSAPLFDEAAYVGGVVAMTRMRDRFNSVQMDCGRAVGCIAALLGLRDHDGPDQPLPQTLELLARSGLNEGRSHSIDAAFSRTLCAGLGCVPRADDELGGASARRPLVRDDYVDPLSKERSLAAFAPVANTGLIVAVATPERSLDELASGVKQRLFGFTWRSLALAGSLFAVLVATIKLVVLAASRRRRT